MLFRISAYCFIIRRFIVACSVSLLTLAPIISGSAQSIKSNSWKEVSENGKGTLVIYWFESRPFIFENPDGSLTGIEYDLVSSFTEFLKTKHGVSLEVKWIKAKEFSNVLDRVEHSEYPTFGVSAFSKTTQRKQRVDYSPTYMSDIIVLISNKSVPVTDNASDFKVTFNDLTAITISGTTYEMELRALQKDHNMNFNIKYISSDANILQEVSQQENTFGFIDLPIYLMIYSNDPSINARRQNFYPIKREGYGFIMQRGSDWSEPVNDFFSRPNHAKNLEQVISKYLDIELYQLNERLALESNSHEELLAKEKEFQYRDLQDKTKEIEARTTTNYILAGLMAIALGFSVVIVIQYFKQNQQRQKIEVQQERIELTNKLLEQRNQHLLALDEEKNNLIKILAHDMRQPLSQIEGLSTLLKNNLFESSEEQNVAFHTVIHASKRLSKMITNILDVDAIENGRVQFVAEQVELIPLIEKVIYSFHDLASRKNIKIEKQWPAEALEVFADVLYLTQIFENLISNAIKFSPSGKNILINIFQANDKIRIAVKDEGPGILNEEKEMLFKKFQKLTSRPTGGESSIGLGLAIVKKYVDLMDGKVWCKSEYGHGATFIVEFYKI